MTEPYESASSEELTEFETQARDVGRAVRAQYLGFVEAGFTDQQALLLTRTWMQAYLGKAE